MKIHSVGKSTGYNGSTLTYTIPAPPDYLIERCKYETAEVIISDERTIRPEQRKLIYATLRDIAKSTGDWLNKLSNMPGSTFRG